MSKPVLPRLAAACGIVFPVAMFLAVGNGNSFAPWRAVVSTWALVLFLPFLAYLCGLLRQAGTGDSWVATVALVGGVSGVLLKLVSHVPELAIHHDHLAKGTPLYKALDDMGGAATVITLYPLAICAAAVAVLVLRSRILPRWIGFFAVLTAVSLVVNGAFVFAGFVPGLLVFLLWTLVTAVVLLRQSWAATARAAYAT
jgi:hypothetical protein